jgi:transposase
MTEYPDSLKRTAVQAYLDGPAGFRTIGQQFGVDCSLLRRWVAAYQACGEASLRKRGGPHHSAAFKYQVLQRRWQDRLSLRKVAALFGLSCSSQVGIWERQYYSGGIEALSRKNHFPAMPKPPVNLTQDLPATDDSRSREELLAELNYLRMENEYLKKLKALIQENDRKAASAKKRK